MDHLISDHIESLRFLKEPATPPTAGTNAIEEKRSLHESKEGSRDAEKTRLHPPKAKFWIITITIVAYIAAVVIAVVHHAFARWLDNQDIALDYVDTQRWVQRANNFLSKIVATCLRFVVGIAIVQAAWNAISSEFTTFTTIDDLFSLPSPISVLSLLWSAPKRRLFSVIVLALFFQSLVLVNLIAPGALSVGSKWEMANVGIPNLNLSTEPLNSDMGWWIAMVDHSLNNVVGEFWEVPSECGFSCSFNITYEAPGVFCRDLSHDEISIMPYDEQLFESGQEWIFYESIRPTGEFVWGTDNSAFNFSFTNMSAHWDSQTYAPTNVDQSPPRGQSCKFRDVTYEAQFFYGNNFEGSKYKYVWSDIISNSSTLEQMCSWTNPGALSPDCENYAQNAATMSQAFATRFYGAGNWSKEIFATWQQYPLLGILDYSTYSQDRQISLIVSEEVAQQIRDAFSGVVLGFLLHSDQNKQTSIMVEGKSIWYFHPFTLWTVYGPFLLLALISGLYGIHWAHRADIVRENKFSSLFISSRTREVDATRTLSQQVLLCTKIKYDKTTGRLVLFDQPTDDTKTHEAASKEPVTRDWTRVKIAAPFVLATALAVGHHFFLKSIDGIPEQYFLQFAVNRISIGFAIVVSLCLSTSATVSLIQAGWRALKREGGSIEIIDNFFALPSPKAIALLAKERPKGQVACLIIIGIIINALGLLSSLVPGAATVVNHSYYTTLDVPTSDLSTSYFTGGLGVPSTFDSRWGGVLEDSLSGNPESLSYPPIDCGLACSFKYQYEAPSLICRDLPASEYTVGEHGSTGDTWKLYNGNQENLSSSNPWTRDNIPFIVNYIPLSSGNQLPALNTSTVPVGSSCQCQDGTYEIDFQYEYGTIAMKSTVLYPRNSFTDNCTSLSRNEQFLSESCGNYASKSSTTCFWFAGLLQGSILFNNTARNFTYEGNFNPLIMEKLFTYDLDPPADGFFQPADKSHNLSEALPQLFSNLTVNLLPLQNTTKYIDAFVEDSGPVWVYDARELWAAYAPALASVFVIGLYGFYCIHANGRPMDNKFSTFLMTTRNKELDEAYDGVHAFDGLLKKRLVYSKEGHFVIDPRESQETITIPNTPVTPLKEV